MSISDTPFLDTPRADARDKVRGKALFAADDARREILHAALAVATIGRGRIASLDTRAASAVRDVFVSPPQHQSPIELIATVAEWSDGKLTVHEGTQNAEAIRHGLATALGLAPTGWKSYRPSRAAASAKKTRCRCRRFWWPSPRSG
jgi:CO/xanthine dehydrogenase Mo-binding subunit